MTHAEVLALGVPAVVQSLEKEREALKEGLSDAGSWTMHDYVDRSMNALTLGPMRS